MGKNGHSELSKELKSLGGDLVGAVKAAAKSPEFKRLEREVLSGLKGVTRSLATVFRAAKKSSSTGRIKRRINRVAQLGAEEGRHNLSMARQKATKAIQKTRTKIQGMKKKPPKQ